MRAFAGRRVLLTGHTGFKGAWAGLWLARAGAHVHGLALPPDPGPSLHALLGEGHLAASHMVDLRDRAATAAAVAETAPEIVLHLAAQPIVRESYADPVGTIATNVMGTVNLLDALRGAAGLRAVLVVTSDKVYANDGSGRAHVEADRLGGHDPYSASKAAAEIVAASFAASFLGPRGVALVTARGGNVVGGGDFAADRLVPDLVRAVQAGEPPLIRNPQATRPWQHVLDCLSGYFAYAQAALDGRAVPAALNFGPLDAAPVTVAEIVERLQAAMGRGEGWRQDGDPGLPEMPRLQVDARAAAASLGWRPRLDTAATIRLTAEWYGAWMNRADMTRATAAQIAAYEEDEA